jgi:hypothetical protein
MKEAIKQLFGHPMSWNYLAKSQIMIFWNPRFKLKWLDRSLFCIKILLDHFCPTYMFMKDG